jgi:ATP-dependent Clp protease ATP-binding subunit ClpA
VAFEQFSERAKRVMFLMREVASRNGETALIQPYHLLEALIREDQGEFAARMPNVVAIAGKPVLRPHPFFSEATATAVLVKLERIFPPKAEPIPLSTDMATSAALQRIFTSATELAKQLHNDEVEPLHVLVALLSAESEPSSDILKRVGISRDAAIAVIRTHLS